MATLGLGEHYLMDLIVAVPFAMGLSFVDNRTWRLKKAWFLAAAMITLAVGWMLAIRFATQELAASPILVPALAVATILAATVARYTVSRRVPQERGANIPQPSGPKYATMADSCVTLRPSASY